MLCIALASPGDLHLRARDKNDKLSAAEKDHTKGIYENMSNEQDD
jgi:hypothetical protein